MLAVVRDDGLVLGPTPAPRGAAARGGPAADGVRDGHRVVLLQRAQLGKEQTLRELYHRAGGVPRGTRSRLSSAFPFTLRVPVYLPRSRLPFPVTSRVPGYLPRSRVPSAGNGNGPTGEGSRPDADLDERRASSYTLQIYALK